MEVALHTFFRLVSKSMTLDDLERQKRTLAEKDRYTEPSRKKLNEDRPKLSGKM